MTKYKHSTFPLQNEDNYLLYLKRFELQQAVRLLTHKENVSEPYNNMTELAIPDPA